MRNKIILLICVYFNASIVYSQHNEGKLFRQGKIYIAKGKYEEARKNFELLTSIDSTNFSYNFELGYLYYYYTSDSLIAAIAPFERCLKYPGKNPVNIATYHLANVYLKLNEYDKAIAKFEAFQPHILRGKAGRQLRSEVDLATKQAINAKISASTKSGKKIDLIKSAASEKLIQIENLGKKVNSKFPDYNPVFTASNNSLYFVSRRDFPKRAIYDDKKMEQTYFSIIEKSQFSRAEKYFHVKENPKKTNPYIVVMNDNENRYMILYKGKKLYLSKKNANNEFEKPKLMKGVNKWFSFNPSACFSPDLQYLVFASERKGSLGGKDLYVCKNEGNFNYSKPVNLGENVNTPFDEESPYFSADGKTLYFSSRGLQGMGGFDIFKVNFMDGDVAKPQNLGIPFNTSADDLFFVLKNDGSAGFFASDRVGTIGDLDVFEFKTLLNAPEFIDCKNYQVYKSIIKGFEKDSFEAGTDINLKLLNKTFKQKVVKNIWWKINNQLHEGKDLNFKFDQKGNYNLSCELLFYDTIQFTYSKICFEKQFKIFAEERTTIKNSFFVNEEQAIYEDSLDFIFYRNPAYNANFTLLSELNLLSAYFPLNGFELIENQKKTLKSNLYWLKQNPDYFIKIIAYTDLSGNKEYNLELSKKRAYTVAAYLKQNGIASDRIVEIIGKGGELSSEEISNLSQNERFNNANFRRTDIIILTKNN
jgi:outer membrane protein OmpA-like peptidoglycan-associated protein/predicted negative regulator of RcsB-dependent stress response